MDGQCGSGAFKEWLHGLSPEEFALLNGADDPETDELSSRAREREQANVRSGPHGRSYRWISFRTFLRGTVASPGYWNRTQSTAM
jgi:hypothetical protein